MSKSKQIYVCQECGAQANKWIGQCPECRAWNSLVEELRVASQKQNRGYAGETNTKITPLKSVESNEQVRTSTGLKELDRVLGGGLVSGSVVLIGGDPGIGKSTLLLHSLCKLGEKKSVLYVTGEESLQQVSLRAKRLDLAGANLNLLADTQIERIIDHAKKARPQVLVIDSIQTVFSSELASAPGSVSQVRDCAARLVAFAKQNQVALFLVGHVTKEGSLAGPRVLEHMVDCVLYFEGGSNNRFRILRAIKNRFGAVNELGVFAMTDKGLKEVANPSAMFLAQNQQQAPGSVVMTSWEGSRPLLVEMQALVDTSHLGNPRRVCLGLDQNRLAMLLAVMHRHGGVATYDQDVFVNVVGGIRISETGGDLPLLLAVYSSLRNKKLPRELMAFGELGLSGEIRPVQGGLERIYEAQKHGLQIAIVPKQNAPKKSITGINVIAVSHLSEALGAVAELESLKEQSY